MKLQNTSEQFILSYDGREITIPQGIFTVNDEHLATHILFISNKWKKEVKNITVAQSKDIEIEKEVVAEPEIIPEKKEEVKSKAKEIKK